MGKPIDNKHTKNLDELLEHLHKPSDDLDAFEQEALEGFATLENKQEALDLKARLDVRMEEVVSKKRKPSFIYWSAAAGVALIIGFVLLIKINFSSKEVNEQLAENSAVSNPIGGDGTNQPGAPAELKQEANKTIDSKGFAGKKSSGDSFGQSSNMGPLQKNDQQSRSESNAVTVMDESKDMPAKEAEMDDKKQDNKPVNALASNTKNNETVPASNAAGASSDAEKSKLKEEEDRDADKATKYFSSRKIKKDKTASTPVEASKPKSEIEGTFEKSNIKTASISIKESELNDKITKFLSDKDYKKSFVCTLTVNSDNKVESIVFQNPDLFSKSATKEITEFFKKQKCFKNHEFAVYSTYLLNYKTP